MTAEEYEKKYIDLSKDLCKSIDDYTRRKVKRNNKAAHEIYDLVCDMCKEPEIAEKVFDSLLEAEDINIRSVAAGQCLKYGFHVKRAKRMLKKFCKSENKLVAFEAELTLKVWQGKVPGKSL